MSRVHLPARVALIALVLVLAWFLAGVTGLIAGTAGVALAALKTPRWVAAAAFAALVVAAAATVFEAGPTETYNAHFASRRPVASEVARVAGILALVAIVGSSVDERSRLAPHSPNGERGTGPAPK
jgi:hypothetical protein